MTLRRTPLVRKTPLAVGKPLARTSLLKRSAFVPNRISPTRLRLWRDMRDRVFVRAGGLCDICGGYLNPNVWECHHRRLRSQGGEDDMRNLLALHLSCHTKAHNDRDWAQQCGYIVHHPDDPTTTPVWRHGTTWQLPTATRWDDIEREAA